MLPEKLSLGQRLERLFFPCATKIDQVVKANKKECDDVVYMVKQNADQIRNLVSGGRL